MAAVVTVVAAAGAAEAAAEVAVVAVVADGVSLTGLAAIAGGADATLGRAKRDLTSSAVWFRSMVNIWFGKINPRGPI